MNSISRFALCISTTWTKHKIELFQIQKQNLRYIYTKEKRSGGPGKGPGFGIFDPPPRGYIESILIPTWNPFETTNENIGFLRSYPDGQTVSRLSPSWTCLVIPNFQKWPKTGPESLKTGTFLPNKARKAPFQQYLAVTIESRFTIPMDITTMAVEGYLLLMPVHRLW